MLTQGRPHPLHPGQDLVHAVPPPRYDISEFNFSPRAGHVDWKLLHGIDPDSVVSPSARPSPLHTALKLKRKAQPPAPCDRLHRRC